VREKVAHGAKAARVRATRAEHPLAIEALRPVKDVFLGCDPPRTAVARHFLEARVRELLQEQRKLGKHRLDGLRGGQAPVRAAHGIGPARHIAPGRSRA
jgi:hypothetical protein